MSSCYKGLNNQATSLGKEILLCHITKSKNISQIIFHNWCIKIVRPHQRCSNLYVVGNIWDQFASFFPLKKIYAILIELDEKEVLMGCTERCESAWAWKVANTRGICGWFRIGTAWQRWWCRGMCFACMRGTFNLNSLVVTYAIFTEKMTIRKTFSHSGFRIRRKEFSWLNINDKHSPTQAYSFHSNKFEYNPKKRKLDDLMIRE